LLKRTKVANEVRRAERGVLNIQLLVVRSLPHSSSSSKCAERKMHNEKIQFTQMIIQDIDTTRTFHHHL